MLDIITPYLPLISILMPAVVGVLLWVLNTKLTEIHAIVNSRLTELLAANSRADKAEGTMQGGSNAAEIQKMIDTAIAKAVAMPPPMTGVEMVNAITESNRTVAVDVADKVLGVAEALRQTTLTTTALDLHTETLKTAADVKDVAASVAETLHLSRDGKFDEIHTTGEDTNQRVKALENREKSV